MPAEGAARLLTLSLLEQLSLHAAAANDPSNAASTVTVDAYRTVLNRLRRCITLYRDALGSSVPRKARRRLRNAAKAANGLRDVDLQLAWLARRSRPATSAQQADGQTDVAANGSERLEPSAHQVIAAEWLTERLGRRRVAFASALERSQANTRPFRRFAKRLGVYRTAIRLNELQLSESFAALTGRQLLATMETLRGAITNLRGAGDRRALRRVRRSADHVVCLLEPIASHADATAYIERARTLRDDIDRLDVSAVIADALVEGGRRIGALHMARRLRATVWPRLSETRDTVADQRIESDRADDIARGLLSLAESLSDELAESFESFSTRWRTPEAEQFFGEIEYIATALSES